jgi:peptide/nickel transport system permease protein
MSIISKTQILKVNYQRLTDSDIWYSFKKSPVTVVSAIVTFLFFFVTIFAPFIAPHDPFDLASIDLMDASLPPAWFLDGETRFLLGTDDQGRDILSTIIYLCLDRQFPKEILFLHQETRLVAGLHP